MLSNHFCLFLQETLNSYGIKYFTDGGKQPLNYVTIMLLSLQFQQVVRFLGTQFESSDAQARGDMQMHGAHLAVAMLYHEVGLPLQLWAESYACRSKDTDALRPPCGCCAAS